MKKIFTLTLIVIMNPYYFTNAQISIVSTDMSNVGDTLRSMKDNLPVSFSFGSAGVNQTWDFTSLVGDVAVTNYVVAPSSTPYSANFSTSNLAITSNFIDYLFANKSASAYNLKGFAGDIGGLGLVTHVTFNPTVDSYRFPVQYGGTFSGTYGFTKTIPYSQLPPALQAQIQQALPPGTTVLNVRLTFSSNFTDLIDGWGIAITPIGSYDCLRQKRTEASLTVTEAEIRIGTPPFSFDTWQEVDRQNGNTTDYYWLTKVTKEPLIAVEYDTLRNVSAVRYSLAPTPNVAPVAVNDTGSTTYPNSITLNVIANDSDLNGDNITFQYVTNPVNGTVTDLGSGNVQYASNNGFDGIDTFRYVICDDGIPSLCDTATVSIDVDFSLGISEKTNQEIKLFPNPAIGSLNIQLESSVSVSLEFHLFNSLGKEVAVFPFNGETGIFVMDISPFPSGLYFMKANASDKHEIFSERFVIAGN